MSFREILQRDFLLSATQLEALERHHALLKAWNARMNLTRIESSEDSARLHYGESLFAGQRLPQEPLTIADVGSGPGFPGIPVAVLRPDCTVTLIESNHRKAVFLKEASRGLPNIRILAARAEDVTDRFHWVISRAVRPESVLKLPITQDFALLTSELELATLQLPNLVVKSPYGMNRVLAMFHVEHDRIDMTQ